MKELLFEESLQWIPCGRVSVVGWWREEDGQAGGRAHPLSLKEHRGAVFIMRAPYDVSLRKSYFLKNENERVRSSHFTIKSTVCTEG